jgi:hypothetical protein
MGNDGSGYFLRPEAGPVPFEKLQWRAKGVLHRIIETLSAAVDSAKKAGQASTDKHRPISDTIDTHRASRLFFVSGEPGSGKSTLYLTLKAMLSNEDSKKYSEGYTNQDGLKNLKTAIRWLDPIDLEVAGDEGENLLAAVLVRLFQELEKSDVGPSKECETAIKELEDLATDIGIAWEGNLQARAGALDPDTYSGEVMRAQRARLGINERLRKPLNKLSKEGCYGCHSETLFVLPVDDFYLKPDASLQLLRLLRMISVPRLFFLVMGDITTVEALFVEKSLADWTAVAGSRLFAAQPDRLDLALARARELRARYLRKLLPPGQRESIDPMDWYEALDFEVGRFSNSDAQVETLEDMMGDVELDRLETSPASSADGETLLSFLICPPFSEEDKTQRQERAKADKRPQESKEERELRKDREKDRAAYTALQILDATPRELMDIGAALSEVLRKKERGNNEEGAPLLLLCVRDMVNLVKEEQSFLNEQEQSALEGILPTRHYTFEDMNFEMNRLCLQPDLGRWSNPNIDKLWVRKHRSWELTVNRNFINDTNKEDRGREIGQQSRQQNAKQEQTENDKEIVKSRQDPFAKLPPRPMAWVVLLHDLAWKWNPDSVTGNLVKRLAREIGGWSISKETAAAEAQYQLAKESCLRLPRPIRDQTNEAAKEHTEQETGKQPEDTELETVQQTLQENVEEDKHVIPTTLPGWVVWKNGFTYQHLPMPDFETVQELDRFLRVWNSGIEWSDQKEKARAAKKRAEDLQTRAHGLKTQAGDNPTKQAEAAVAQKQAVSAMGQADEERRKAGDDELQDTNFIALWMLAGLMVTDEQYKDFAKRDTTWFTRQLATLKDNPKVKDATKGWLHETYKIAEVLGMKV